MNEDCSRNESCTRTKYTYDANGNTLTDASGKSYAWDFENRLKQVTLPNSGGTVAFLYDPFGRRIQKVYTTGANPPTSTTTNYVYDGDNAIETVDQNGNALAKFAQGQSIDEPLAELASGATSFYEQDGLGSVTSLTNSAGALAQSYTYDSFGNITNSSGNVANPFRYTGRDFDAETGLYYYRARYYDPNTGRFLSEDPVQFDSGFNFYSYVGNTPTGAFDPSGLCLVRMLYSPVKFLGMTVGWHAFLVVSNNTGGPPSPWAFRAGPGSGGSWWTPNLEALGVPYMNDPKLNPDWDPNAKSQTLLDDCSDCKNITRKLDDYDRRVNNSNIPYHSLSTNSNAYASGAATAAGLPLPTPPVPVRGWGVPLPVKPR
jgi:RHS repeat-associated protein